MTYNELQKQTSKNEKTLKVSESAKLSEQVLEYMTLKAQIKELESKVKDLSTVLKTVCKKTPDSIVLVAGHKISITDITRETFSLKNAREGLAPEDFKEFIKPYVNDTEYTQVNVTEVKAAKEEAA